MSSHREEAMRRETAFGLGVGLRALGDGIVVSLTLLIWRSGNLALDPEPARLLVWFVILRLVSERVLRRYADATDRALMDCAASGAASILFLVHGSMPAATIFGGICLLHWKRAVRHAALPRGPV